MKKNLFFLLFTAFSFSQGKVFTIAEIDSIAEINGRWSISEGIINADKTIVDSKKNKVSIKGKGGFSTTTYLNYFNQDYYDGLSNEEKRKYNREKDSELVKAKFNQVIWFDDTSGEKISAFFYYHNLDLFFAKVKYTRIIKEGEEESQEFNLSAEDIQDPKPIKNAFLFDVKPWIIKKNSEILENFKS